MNTNYYPKDEIFTITDNVKLAMSTVTDASSSVIFDEDANVTPRPVPGYDNYKYIPFGYDDALPFNIIKMIGADEIMSQNKLFNALTCYGAGIQYIDKTTKEETDDDEIARFVMSNSLKEFHIEQCTDMKYFYYSVAVVILNRDRTKIVQVRHKDACFCRFEKADKQGRINHVFVANWRKPSSLSRKDVEVITLLNEKDPLGHLEVLTGRAHGADGLKKSRTNEYKFAILMRFPTPGHQYYPIPYYTSVFRGDWWDIKRLIGRGKKAKLKYSSAVKYQVEIHKDYWENICVDENITDPLKRAERIKKEKENIRNFVTGIENSGKMWITGFYAHPNGQEVHMVRINKIDTSKEGGDWSEDIQEAANMICYVDNIHPNLVGATPGKSQSNNSGSDKRELFTLKQSLEQAFHDMMSKVHNVVIYYNGWNKKVKATVPLIMLTTLDQNNDAKRITDGKVSNPNE